MNATDYTESQIRAMRDRVFSQRSTEANWLGCRDHWQRPDSVKWLEAHDPEATK